MAELGNYHPDQDKSLMRGRLPKGDMEVLTLLQYVWTIKWK